MVLLWFGHIWSVPTYERRVVRATHRSNHSLIVESRESLKSGHQLIHALRLTWDRATPSISTQDPENIIRGWTFVSGQNGDLLQFCPSHSFSATVRHLAENSCFIKRHHIFRLQRRAGAPTKKSREKSHLQVSIGMIGHPQFISSFAWLLAMLSSMARCDP